MTAVHRTTSLHTKTVTKFSRDEIDKIKKAKRKRGSNKNSPVRHLKVHELVWEAAMDLLTQDKSYTTVEIIDWNEVIVR